MTKKVTCPSMIIKGKERDRGNKGRYTLITIQGSIYTLQSLSVAFTPRTLKALCIKALKKTDEDKFNKNKPKRIMKGTTGDNKKQQGIYRRAPVSGIFLFMFFALQAYTQVGIGNKDPDTTAALHVGQRNTKKGLLIPARTNTSGIPVENLKESLMFYTSDKQTFVFWDGDNWQSMNPWEAIHHIDTISTTKHIVTQKTGKEQGTKYNIQHNNETGTPMAAIGSIIMWSGDPTALPSNWKLCNGGKYYEPISGDSIPIPDLSGRFVVGYDATDPDYDTIGTTGPPVDATDYDVLEKGKKIRLKTGSMPDHYHNILRRKHSHGFSSSIGLSDYTKREYEAHKVIYHKRQSTLSGSEIIKFKSFPPSFPHDHPITGSIDTGYAEITTENTGNTEPHENRPPYYTLAYIIRVW